MSRIDFDEFKELYSDMQEQWALYKAAGEDIQAEYATSDELLESKEALYDAWDIIGRIYYEIIDDNENLTNALKSFYFAMEEDVEFLEQALLNMADILAIYEEEIDKLDFFESIDEEKYVKELDMRIKDIQNVLNEYIEGMPAWFKDVVKKWEELSASIENIIEEGAGCRLYWFDEDEEEKDDDSRDDNEDNDGSANCGSDDVVYYNDSGDVDGHDNNDNGEHAKWPYGGYDSNNGGDVVDGNYFMAGDVNFVEENNNDFVCLRQNSSKIITTLSTADDGVTIDGSACEKLATKDDFINNENFDKEKIKNNVDELLTLWENVKGTFFLYGLKMDDENGVRLFLEKCLERSYEKTEIKIINTIKRFLYVKPENPISIGAALEPTRSICEEYNKTDKSKECLKVFIGFYNWFEKLLIEFEGFTLEQPFSKEYKIPSVAVFWIQTCQAVNKIKEFINETMKKEAA